MKLSKTGKALGDYSVGYGRPPKAHQFKPGQSGNAKGRQRKHMTLKSSEVMRREFMAAMEQEVTVNRNGRRQKVSAIRALYDQILATALKGDFRAMKLASEMYRACVTEDEDQRMRLLETLLDFEKARDEEAQARIAGMAPEEIERKDTTETAIRAMRKRYRNT